MAGLSKAQMKKLVKNVQDADLIVTPRYEHYLLSGKFDEPLPKHIALLVMKLLMMPQRDRSGTFSASSAGQCLRRQEFEFLGMPQPPVIEPRLANIFMDGRWRHLRWQAHLMNAGILNAIEARAPWKRMYAMGSMDGTGEVPHNHPHHAWRNEEWFLEFKGANPYVWTRMDRDEILKDEYLDQIHRYFLQTGIMLCVVIVENKATNEWFEWVIEADPKRLATQRAELETLNEDRRNGSLRPMLAECVGMRSAKARDCPFGGKHGPCAEPGSRSRIQRLFLKSSKPSTSLKDSPT